MLAGFAFYYFGRGLPDGRADFEKGHPHEEVNCELCHKFDGNMRGFGVRVARNAMCLTCHTTAKLHDVKLRSFHAATTPNCNECHSFHAPSRVIANGDTTTMAIVAGLDEICADCHNKPGRPVVSVGHEAAARLIHGSLDPAWVTEPSQYCMACHDADAAPRGDANTGQVTPRIHTVGGHAIGIPLIPGFQRAGADNKIRDQIPEFVRTINGNIECLTCHSLSSGSAFLLVTGHQNDLCNGCHNVDPNIPETRPPVFTQRSANGDRVRP